MGVRIDVVGWPVGGPTGVANANRSRWLVFSDVVGQINHLALLFLDTDQATFFQRGNAGAVIPSVFKSLESFD